MLRRLLKDVVREEWGFDVHDANHLFPKHPPPAPAKMKAMSDVDRDATTQGNAR